jgi:uncharacterized membrane protein YbhN (UPF0104 family)
MKRLMTFVWKLVATLAIFAALFFEFGGGYRPVPIASLSAPGTFQIANQAYPGMVGRLKARFTGATLPPARLDTTLGEVCAHADRAVFVRTDADAVKRFKGRTHHCHDGALATVYARTPDGSYEERPLAGAPDPVYFRIQGFQLVPAEPRELWEVIRTLDIRVFLLWMLAATLIKTVGIFANIWRWQVLLRGQGIDLKFGFLTSTYFIGRYFGIVTPSTMGLDAWRLYETIRLTKRPVECTTVLAVERVIGLVGLLAVILGFMPFAGALTQGQTFGELVAAMRIPLAGALLFGTMALLRPAWFQTLLRLVPSQRIRGFAGNVINSATAYSDKRGHLLLALGLAVIGQITTTLMYFCNAMSLGIESVTMNEVLFTSAVMTFGTFIAPSASGEGVREWVFVKLLEGRVLPAQAFFIGNLGFWIEKGPLSIPGGIILWLRKDPTLKGVTREDLERVRSEAQAN